MSCSNSDTSNSSTTPGTPVSAKLKNPNAAFAFSESVDEPSDISQVSMQPSIFAYNATSSSTNLTSLKYVILSASMCTTVTVNGSAFTSTSGCVSLYDSGLGDGTQVTNTTIGNFASKQIDLMSATSLSSFNLTADKKGSAAAGTYNYVVINWAPWIAATGSVSVNGTTIYTKSCTVDGTGLCYSSTPLSTGPAQESLTKSANGGTWFKFQQPFIITAADVAAQTAYTVDLVFNGTGAVAAATNVSAGASGSVADVSGATLGNTVYVPMIQLTPVPRKASDTISKETYTITTTDANATIRVELYYQKSDTTKTIYGVNLLTVLNNSTTTGPTGIDIGSKVATITTLASGNVTLNDTNGSAVITNLTRRANGSVTNAIQGGGTQTSTYVGTTDL